MAVIKIVDFLRPGRDLYVAHERAEIEQAFPEQERYHMLAGDNAGLPLSDWAEVTSCNDAGADWQR